MPAAAATKREAHSRGSDQAEVLYDNIMLAIWQLQTLGWGMLLCIPKNLYCKGSLLHVEIDNELSCSTNFNINETFRSVVLLTESRFSQKISLKLSPLTDYVVHVI